VTCHAEDFGSREPRICGACHNGTEPWRALVADRGPPDSTEFGATLDHGKHPGACERCHALSTSASQLRPPRGHRACTGSGCHAVTGGPAPALGACERCHRQNLIVDRQAARLAAPWSVRRAFDHATHARGSGGQPLACEACHVDLSGADVAALATPPKPSCAPCHDGSTAFKLTGTTCTRCHEGAPR
jgi:c(7)-type cytochrome triheme protein